MSNKFNWRKYCLENGLASSTTKSEAMLHCISKLQINCLKDISIPNNKHEPFSINYNHNKNIAIFCHTIPTPDQDSGSNRLYEIIKILIEMDYNVYYFTHSLAEPKYVELLANLIKTENIFVIDTLNEIYSHQLFNQVVKNKNINFDIAIFYFHDMYTNYAKAIKNICPTIKTIIDSVDVHWLRLARGNLLNNNSKTKEKLAYNDADVVFAVTENDKNEILKECPNANVKIVSNIHHINLDHNYLNYESKNLLFVGGSKHTPNIGAAIRAIEIFDEFLLSFPEYKTSQLFLVGSYFDQKIIELVKNKSSNIKILGHLNTNELDSLYANKVIGTLSPIDWGAGIKGKVCESICHNIPVITTNIGNEGIDLEDGISGFIFNTNQEAIQSIKNLFDMTKQDIINLVEKAKNRIKILISPESAKDILSGTLQSKQIILSIASFNKALLLERCVNSIIQNTVYPNYIVHITSNGCSDNTKDIIKKLVKIHGSHKIKFTLNKTNKHFISAHNDVIKLYPENDIILINNDMEFFSPLWLHHLYSSAYSSPLIGCAGGKLLDYNFRISEFGACLYNDGSGKNMYRGESRYHSETLKTKYTGYVSGCLMYMKRSLINKYGGLDTRFYPCYYEDSDWQYATHLDGYKTIVNPKCEVLHMEGASSKDKIIDTKHNFKEQAMNTNKNKFLEKYKSICIEDFNL